MTLKAPQIILIAIYMLSLGISMARHGEEKKGKESFFTSTIAAAIQIGLLYWGGFFS
ncbi:hypothetical protein [Metaclostridioides mangenotii]|uniref:hypothetical protein n=1 Tax=Metaclostridioides mangenotii TaxID=1540 RepID=UPI0004B41EDE|nr:hypothetical protein [Clostridioides mangenotii]